MIDFFHSGGVMMWPILACGLLVLALAVRASIALAAGDDGGRSAAVSATDAVLFWGGLGAVLGLLGTIVGLTQMASVLERFEELSSTTLWGGFRVTLVTTIAGLVILILALLMWLALRWAGSRRALA